LHGLKLLPIFAVCLKVIKMEKEKEFYEDVFYGCKKKKKVLSPEEQFDNFENFKCATLDVTIKK